MRKIFNTLLLAIFAALIIFASRWIGDQAYSWMPTQGTAEAQQVDELFSFLVAIGAFIFLGIVGVLLFAIATCRAPQGDFSHGHPARSDWRIEVAWTVIPVILVMWIAGQSYKIYQTIDIQGLTPIAHMHMPISDEPAYAATKPTEDNTNTQKVANLEIKVVAKQWAWSFQYPNQVVSSVLHLPVNQNVKLILESEDVLHGFYVPEFRLKQDIIPNRDITFVFMPLKEGKYKLRDSQFSGTYFALMDADVYVESAEKYNDWLQQVTSQRSTPVTNSAWEEYQSNLQKGIKPAWPTVVPAAPHLVRAS